MATVRTPVRVGRNPNGQCQLCIEEDEPLMVLCTSCKRKFHVTCVDITPEQEKVLSFVCDQCVKLTEQSGRTVVTRKFSKHLQDIMNAEAAETLAEASTSQVNPIVQPSTSQVNPIVQPSTSQVNPIVQPSTSQVDTKVESNANKFNPKAPVFTPSKKQTSKSVKSNHSSKSNAERKRILELRLQNLQKQEEIIQQLDEISAQGSQVDDNSDVENNDSADDENNGDVNENLVQRTVNAIQTPTVNQQPFVPSISTTNNQQQPGTNQTFYHVRVKENLHDFDGNPENWPLFISHYHLSTNRHHYTNDDNLERLQKALKGKARELVLSQLFMPSCVPKILKKLEKKFGRPEYILNAQIDRIRLEPPIKKDKLTTLINFSSLVDNLCATMEAAKMTSYMNSPLLLQELVQKLPVEMQLDWAEFNERQATHNLITFQEFLEGKSDKACSVMPYSVFKSEFNTKPKEKSKEKHHVNVHIETPPKVVESKIVCPMCSNNCVSMDKCNTFKKLSLSEKWDAIKKHKICRCCLKVHIMKFPYRCREAKRCGVNNCERKHHQLMHNDNPKDASQQNNEVSQQNVNATLCSHIIQNTQFQFRYIPVVLANEEQTLTVMAFLDEGSSGTFIEQSLAEKLHLKGPKTSICLKWTKNQHRIEKNSMKVSLTIYGTYKNAPEFTLSNAQTVESLDLPKQSLDYEQLANKYPYLSHLPVESYYNAAPQLLIGLNNWRYAVPLKVKEGDIEQPIATKCRLGWSILAAERSNNPGVQLCNFHETQITNEDMHLLMKQFFSFESMGVKIPPENTASKEEQRALTIMKNTTKFIGDRYETGLLWSSDDVKLPDNRQTAIKRLKSLEVRLKQNPVLLDNVKNQLSQYIEKGYIRKITEQELHQSHERIWYLPIFPTSNPNKPEKTRIVWDAASKTNDVSLNSVLLKGPDQLSSLFGILIRFREKKIAVTGDIAEMYHQVRIIPQDQHSQRFLWRDCDTTKDFDEYLMQVMTFGASCSPASAQFVKNYNAEKYSDVYPRAVKSIHSNHYVDDMLDCTDDVEEAFDLIEKVTAIHQAGGFQIRKWKSNSKDVMQKFGEVPQNTLDFNFGQNEIEKVLGLFWDMVNDNFTFSLKFNKGNQEVLKGLKKPTKREVLRILMSIYDPLGLIAHFLSYLKVLLQKIWISKVDWDNEIRNDHFNMWVRWVKQLSLVEQTRIPRCYLSKINSSWKNSCKQLHIFTDASQENCCAVAYLRTETEEDVHCALVCSKTKVASLKLTSIPRLELIAALLGARLAKTLLDSFSEKITKVTFWTDSQVVLKWINCDARRIKGQFVAFRVAEIQEISDVSQWRHVPSNENVADEATKWQKLPTFDENQRWFKGPSFLYEDESMWPKPVEICHEELEILCFHLEVTPLIEVGHFSSWNSIQKTAAFVYRFVNIINSRAKHEQQPIGMLTSAEYKSGESLLFRQTQLIGFPEEIDALKNSGMVPKTSWTYKLCPYLDENGVMCSKTRISHVKLIILPRHDLTRLIIHKYHVRYLHQFNETVVNELKKKYYIPQIRPELKKVIKDCQECKNESAAPVPPMMSDIPECRLSTFQPAFTYTGVDYFGPINVKVGRSYVKRWGCLFVCMTTRAIHIEVAHELSTDAFILCYRNFMNRRGPVQHMFSDNGTNFVGAERVLKEALKEINNEEIAATFTSTDLQWHFNPPASPHMGGSWERLVRTVKNAFYSIKPFHTLTDPLLNSYLIEIENMVNSRPLTYLPIDSEENEALTPNHFIRLVGSSVPIGKMQDDAKFMKYNWQTSQLLLQRFWKRWVSEYLPTLTRRSKWCKLTEPLEKGDVVIICDPKATRNTWPKGRVIEVNYGPDGQTRSAAVKTMSGVLVRPTVKLAKLDVKPPTVGPGEC